MQCILCNRIEDVIFHRPRFYLPNRSEMAQWIVRANLGSLNLVDVNFSHVNRVLKRRFVLALTLQ
jgi:hypothetical protein